MRYVPLAPVGQQIAVSQDAMAYVQQNADPTIEQAMVSHTFSNITGTALLGSSALTPQLNEIPLVSAPASQAIGIATGNIAGRLANPRSFDRVARNPQPDFNPKSGVSQPSGPIYR